MNTSRVESRRTELVDLGGHPSPELDQAAAPSQPLAGASQDTAGKLAGPGVAPGAQSGAVVLYIEDDRVNPLIAEQMLLRRAGVSLILADRGQDGIALARLQQPDLVLRDMQPPDMTGSDGLAYWERPLKLTSFLAGVAALPDRARPDGAPPN